MITGLNVVRIIRVIAGIGFMTYGIMTHHYLLVLMGGIVGLLGVLNIGCPLNACSLPASKNERTVKEVEYEDLSK